MTDAYTGSKNIFGGSQHGQTEMICSRCQGNFAGDERNLIEDLVICDVCKKELGLG